LDIYSDYLKKLLDIPQDNLAGLTPNEVAGLLNTPYDEHHSPMLLNKQIDVELIKQVHFYNDVVKYLTILQKHQPLKLTQKGNLPLFFCQILVDEDICESEYKLFFRQFPIKTELDNFYVHTINIITRIAGLTRKKYNRLLLTKNATKYLKSNSVVELYLTILKSYTVRCNWTYFDGHLDSAIIQAGFGFSIYLVQKYGAEPRKFKFYADKYLRAFPRLINNDFAVDMNTYLRCYYLRVFERFLNRFELITIEGSTRQEADMIIKKTPLIDQVFKWKGDLIYHK